MTADTTFQKQILAVDDHSLFRAGLELIVRQNLPLCHVHSASSLSDALAMPGLAPDLVLLDLHLEGQASGFDAVHILRMRWPECPVVIITADTSSDLMFQARDHAVDGYLLKSDPTDKVIATIRRLLGNPAVALAEQSPLTRRQSEILRLLRQGMSNKAIAKVLGISEFTVRGHVQQLLKSLQVNNRAQAVFAAQQAGLL